MVLSGGLAGSIVVQWRLEASRLFLVPQRSDLWARLRLPATKAVILVTTISEERYNLQGPQDSDLGDRRSASLPQPPVYLRLLSSQSASWGWGRSPFGTSFMGWMGWQNRLGVQWVLEVGRGHLKHPS